MYITLKEKMSKAAFFHNFAVTICFLTLTLTKDLFRYGRKEGGLKNPYIFTETQYFFEKKCENTFDPEHIKAEGMIKFDIFHTLVENSVNSVICFF